MHLLCLLLFINSPFLSLLFLRLPSSQIIKEDQHINFCSGKPGSFLDWQTHIRKSTEEVVVGEKEIQPSCGRAYTLSSGSQTAWPAKQLVLSCPITPSIHIATELFLAELITSVPIYPLKGLNFSILLFTDSSILTQIILVMQPHIFF